MELLGNDTLNLTFPDSSNVVMKYLTAGGKLTACTSAEIGYSINGLKIRRFDYQKFKRVPELQMKTQVLYVPEYVQYQQNLTGSTQQIDFQITKEPGSYLLATIFAAGLTNLANIPNAMFECTNLSNVGYTSSNFRGFKVELNNNPLIQYTNIQDYVNYMTSIVKHLKNHSLFSENAIEYYGAVPIFFDTDYENIFNPNYNVGRGLPLDEEQSIKITFNVNSFNGKDDNAGTLTRNIYALGIKLRPYYLINGVLSVNPPISYE